MHRILNPARNIHVSVKQIRRHEHYQTWGRKIMNISGEGSVSSLLPDLHHKLPSTITVGSLPLLHDNTSYTIMVLIKTRY
jgi:hypothetical protein